MFRVLELRNAIEEKRIHQLGNIIFSSENQVSQAEVRRFPNGRGKLFVSRKSVSAGFYIGFGVFSRSFSGGCWGRKISVRSGRIEMGQSSTCCKCRCQRDAYVSSARRPANLLRDRPSAS